ncbi:hypothetical protein PUNSTDRAFT_54143 [Punctularia strigosozonata HHB-11173 SS5]|uniref:uncharacterized protein n=1 Tax=Punctularia strigosozonata (strain HHB-11173) TaxID=741275 RepID=UPI00044179EE|nr:uncharacterized protein PUNSTDRAFT_54143 [Punctularia strigosozonata HHB-11173 SS5]EIN06747.1 hypothetical protein PUNSTDRAFT_54143 [Punctularia strigosozonata HHB-11173 SS5]
MPHPTNGQSNLIAFFDIRLSPNLFATIGLTTSAHAGQGRGIYRYLAPEAFYMRPPS